MADDSREGRNICDSFAALSLFPVFERRSLFSKGIMNSNIEDTVNWAQGFVVNFASNKRLKESFLEKF